MKTYTEKFVDKLTRDCVQGTQEGMKKWILYDVGIRNKITKKKIEMAELYLLPKSEGLTKRVWKELEKRGIKFTKIK